MDMGSLKCGIRSLRNLCFKTPLLFDWVSTTRECQLKWLSNHAFINLMLRLDREIGKST